uniref:Uncharacterized protein n=1 Tax=Vespula pensylvanica TaxID=30213 RepID=A0A834KMU8_VESPE|nr:hypothetical protein H0235_014562 [Vespula pensylvanica]
MLLRVGLIRCFLDVMEREERPTQEGAPPLVLAMSYLVLEPGRDRTCERASRAGWCASAIKRETVVVV